MSWNERSLEANRTIDDGIKHHIYFIINDNYRKLISEPTMRSAANQTLARGSVACHCEDLENVKEIFKVDECKKRFVFIVSRLSNKYVHIS